MDITGWLKHPPQSYLLVAPWKLKNCTFHELVCKAETETDVENKCMDTKGGKRRVGGGMNWEIGIDIYTLICIK